MGIKMLVQVLNYIRFEMKVTECFSVLDALDTDTNLSKHPHFNTRETHFLALEVHHLYSKFSYQ